MIKLKSLKESLAKVAELGWGECKVNLEGIEIHLRTLRESEEIDALRNGKSATPEDDPAYNRVFIEIYRRAILSYAIVQIGDTDLRNETTIETDEIGANGLPIRLQKHKAVDQLIQEWSPSLQQSVFQKYAELINRVDIDAEKKVTYDPAELEVEISRLEKRLEALRKEKSTRENPKRNDSITKEVAKAAQDEMDRREQLQKTLADIPPQSPRSAPPQRTRITPESAPPPVRSTPNPPRSVEPAPEELDSFAAIDENTIAKENARLLAMRSGRTAPPHKEIDTTQPVGKIGETDVYVMGERTVLGSAGQQPPVNLRVDQPVTGRPNNPRFKPPHK